MTIRLGNLKDSKHTYEAGVEKDGVRSTITIDANTRTIAGKIARDNGFTVRDMNMVG